MPSIQTLRRASGALILAVVLGLSTGQAIAASGYKKLTPSKITSNAGPNQHDVNQIT